VDADLTHVYAVAKLEGGEPIFTVLTRNEIEKYRNRSRASKSGPWVTDFEAMALKTGIRRLFRWLPKSAEMARAAAIDEAPEIGKSQLEASDSEVLGYLQAQGLDVEGATQPLDDQTDPETGEVPAPAEPGSDG
jgi:recombination protein RecT